MEVGQGSEGRRLEVGGSQGAEITLSQVRRRQKGSRGTGEGGQQRAGQGLRGLWTGGWRSLGEAEEAAQWGWTRKWGAYLEGKGINSGTRLV